MLRRRQVNNDIEEKILTGLIISDRFCRETYKLIKKDTFQIPHAQVIGKWVLDYYKQYKSAPQLHIQDLYTANKGKLKEEEVVLVTSFLNKISSRFENEESLNEDYLIDKSIDYFKQRSLKNIAERIESFLDLGKLADAEKELQSYREVRKDSSKFVNPFTKGEVKKYFEDEANKINQMFAMPGALGELIGYFERGTFVAVMGPAKRGKSFLLMEIAIQAFFEKYKVLYVSLEMNLFKMKRRLLKRVTAFGEEKKEYVYPCFDCYRNQIDACNKQQRTGFGKLRDEEGNKPFEYDSDLAYKPCTACRGKKDFIVDSWFTKIERPKRNLKNTEKVVQGIEQMFHDNFRLICYPKFSASVSQIKSDIEYLEYDEDFIPDVIVIDYADILAPEDLRETGREKYDATWKMFGNLADVRKALVVSASQTNRQSFEKKNVVQTDAAEDIRKIAHVETMLALNQTAEEKRQGIMRIALIAGRDDDFDQYKTCMVLQNIGLGQVYLDSEIIRKISKETQKTKEKKGKES